MNATQEIPRNFDLVLDVPVSLTVELGGCKLPMSEVLQLAPGSVVQLEKSASEPLDLLVNGKLIARGEVVVLDERFGIRVTELLNSQS
jgi:flagellar motor switch protein FliN